MKQASSAQPVICGNGPKRRRLDVQQDQLCYIDNVDQPCATGRGQFQVADQGPPSTSRSYLSSPSIYQACDRALLRVLLDFYCDWGPFFQRSLRASFRMFVKDGRGMAGRRLGLAPTFYTPSQRLYEFGGCHKVLLCHDLLEGAKPGVPCLSTTEALQSSAPDTHRALITLKKLCTCCCFRLLIFPLVGCLRETCLLFFMSRGTRYRCEGPETERVFDD